LPALSSSPNEESLLTIPSVQPQSPSPSQLDDGVCPLTDGGAGFPLNVTPPCSGSMCSIEIFQSPMSPNSSPGFPPPESEGSRQPSCDSSLSYVGCDDEPLGDSPSTPSTVTSSSKLTKRVRFSLPLNPITTPQPLPANAPAPGSAPPPADPIAVQGLRSGCEYAATPSFTHIPCLIPTPFPAQRH